MSNDPVSCRLFGTTVLTHIPPPACVPAKGAPDLDVAPLAGHKPMSRKSSPLLSLRMFHPEADGLYQVWQTGASLLLRVAPLAEFECSARSIRYRLLQDLSLDSQQWQLYGLVMGAWSEWSGRPVLHAATVEVSGGAVAFLGASGAGKSSLTLEFLASGHRVLGDDQLVLDGGFGEIRAVPALPWLKVGLDVVGRAVTNPSALPRVHSVVEKRRLELGTAEWSPVPLPLRRLYVVERGWHLPRVAIEPLGPSEGLVSLIRHTYLPRTVEAVRLTEGRLPLLAAAAGQAGVFRLRFPDGLDWLARVRDAVVRHASEPLLPTRSLPR